MTKEPHALNLAVGATLRRSLREAGYSVRVAADLAGLSYRSVRRYVAGERDMPVPVLLALVRATGSDLVLLAQRLQHELQSEIAAPDEVQGHPGSMSADVARNEADQEEAADSADSYWQLEARLQRLGVTRLAARSVRPIDSSEQSAVLDVVEQIVLGIREDQAAARAPFNRS